MFQRARSQEQREARRQAILGAAAAMLAEMPVAEVTLNELSRRAGLAKSNVLRYFESREAVLLELLDSAWQDWLAQLDADLADAVDPGAPPGERTDQLAATVAASLAARPMLCDLVSAQAAVLERNVSPQVAAQYKRASMAGIAALGGLMLRCVPELGEQDAFRLAAAVAASLAARPMLCDLLSAQAAVLEHNVSPQVAARYKRASMAGISALGGLMLRCVPELGEPDAFRLAGATVMTASALWPHTQPSAAMLAAYAADPELAAMRLDFTATLREVLEVMTAGLLAPSPR